MRPGPVVIFVSQLIVVHSQQEQLLNYNYRHYDEPLMTMEGRESGSSNVYRQSFKRFLSFNNDASNIRVEMVFAVPFLHIPIGGKTVDGPYGNGVTPVVDINAKSLLTASVILFMLFFIIPKFVRVFVPTLHEGRAFEESEISRVMRGVESVFNMNSTACWQQAVCSLVHSSHLSSVSEQPPNWAKVIDGISSVKWLEQITSGSSFGEALVSAKMGEEGCKAFYKNCPLSVQNVEKFAKELARRYMNHLIHLTNKAGTK